MKTKTEIAIIEEEKYIYRLMYAQLNAHCECEKTKGVSERKIERERE